MRHILGRDEQSKGGRRAAAKMTAEQRSARASRAAKESWAKLSKEERSARAKRAAVTRETPRRRV